MIAHVLGLPVEEMLALALAVGGGALSMAVRTRLPRRRAADAERDG